MVAGLLCWLGVSRSLVLGPRRVARCAVRRAAPIDAIDDADDRLMIYDTTLRDGTQGESVSASCDDKLCIARRLSQFGVDWIEAGWPGSNPKDAEFFKRAATELDEATRYST